MEPKLALVVPVLNQHELFRKNLATWRDTAAAWDEIELLVIDNGSTPAVDEPNVWTVRNDQNIGVLKALQQGYELTTAPWIIYTHTDVEMLDRDWDSRIRRFVASVPDAGLVGLFGAKGFALPGVYRHDFNPHNLPRVHCVCGSPAMPKEHGHRGPVGVINHVPCEEVAVLDGYFMCVSRKFLDENSGFDLGLPSHHMYDAHTCLQAIERGYKNFVMTLDAYHMGGGTDGRVEWAEALGTTRHEVWLQAHRYTWDYWHPSQNRKVRLPYLVRR